MIAESVQTQLLETLNFAVQRFLKLDPESVDRLQPLVGRVVQCHITQLEWRFLLTGCDQTLTITRLNDPQSHHTNPQKDSVERADVPHIDATISASPGTLLQLALRQDPKQRLFKNDMSIHGDVHTAAALQDLFKQMDIDWESHLAPLLGDALAFRVAQGGRKLKRFAKGFFKSFGLNVRDYVQEEARWLPPALEVEDFYEAIATLRDDVSRVTARIEFLKRRLTP